LAPRLFFISAQTYAKTYTLQSKVSQMSKMVLTLSWPKQILAAHCEDGMWW